MSETVQIKAPWLASKDPEVPATLNYSTLSMCGRVEEMVRQYPNYTAYEFMGKTTTYAEMWQKINACAKSLKAIGIREGDKVTICMPNAPQTLCMFYAVNMVGAIANMVHPLSAESEISFYLRDSNSVAAITLDQFYPKFESVRKTVDLPCLIVTSVADELKPLLRVGYQLTEGRKNPKVPRGPGVVLWKDFLKRGEHVEIYRIKRKDTDPAAILYSGGTTGVTKGILLSNRNFNALAAQIVATNPFFHPGHKMLRTGRVHPLHGGQRRPLHPDPPLHPSELRRAHQEAQAQSHRRRSLPVRGAAAGQGDRRRRPQLPEGCVLRR